MATLPGNIPDPIPPEPLSAGASTGDTLRIVGANDRESEVEGVWPSVKSWWRTDQTRWVHKEFITTDMLCLLASALGCIYGTVAISHLRSRFFDPVPVKTNLGVLLLMAVLVTLF